MTDVIGWGGTDRAPHRRWLRRRWPVWVLVALVAAGIALAGPAERALGDHAAEWLARQWSLRQSIANARTAAALQAVGKAGVGDGPAVLSAFRSLDREAADDLTRVEQRIAGHRMWAGDVRNAASAARAALRAEAGDLRAHRPQVAYAVYDGEPSTLRLIRRVDVEMTGVEVHHHVRAPAPAAMRLHAADTVLRQLSRITDVPTGLHLLLTTETGFSVVDLDSGHERPFAGQWPYGNEHWPVVVGGRLLVTSGDRRFSLLGLAGRSSIPLPRAEDYRPAGADGLWAQPLPGSIRRLDATGHPLGPSVALPEFTTVYDASRTMVLLGPESLDAPQRLFVWNPSTGAEQAVPTPPSCEAALTDERVIWMPCRHGSTLVVQSLRTHRRRLLSVPAGARWNGVTSVPIVSAQGTLAAAVARAGSTQVDALDVRTGRVDVVPDSRGLDPVSWSSDGRWLLLAPADGADQDQPNPAGLALWRVGGARLYAVRVPLSRIRSQRAALLPDGVL